MLSLLQGDILQVAAEAIVVPSNNQLVAGAGLSEQAYKFFGEKELHQACQNYLKKKKETHVPYTKVVSTEIRNNRTFRYVFHAIVPVFDHSKQDFSEQQMMRLLENMYNIQITSLNEVKYLNIASISIPALGCGMNLYPFESFLVAFAGVFSENLSKFPHVKFNLVLYDKKSYDIAQIILETLINRPQIQQQQLTQKYQQQQNQNSQQQQPLQQPIPNNSLKNYKEKEQQIKQKKDYKFGTFTESEILKKEEEPQIQHARFTTQTQNTQQQRFIRDPKSNFQNKPQNQADQQNLGYPKQEFVRQSNQYQQFNNSAQNQDLHNNRLYYPNFDEQNKGENPAQQVSVNTSGNLNLQKWETNQPQNFQSNFKYPKQELARQTNQQQQYNNSAQKDENLYDTRSYQTNFNEQNKYPAQQSSTRKNPQQQQEQPQEDFQVITQGDLYRQKSETYQPIEVQQYPPGDFIKQSNIPASNYRYIYLQITIDEKAAITNEKSLITLLLNICKQMYALHKLIYEKPENKIKQGLNCELTYKVEKETRDIINFASPEMIESQYIADASDMFSLGLVIYKIIFKRNPLPNDYQQYKQILEGNNVYIIDKRISYQGSKFQYSSDIQSILDKLLTDETSARLMPNSLIQILLTLSNDEELQQNWQNHLMEMTKFYKNQTIMVQLKQNLKQLIDIANKEGTVKQIKADSEVQVQDGPVSEIVYEKKNLLQQKIEQEQKQTEIQYSESHSSLYSQLNKQKQDPNDLSQFQIGCVVIPINKKNPQICDILKPDSRFKQQFQGLLEFALMEQEYFIQTMKCQVPIFGCNQVIFVFCPDENSNDGRRIRLQRCYQDILLYAYKCLKLESICLCLDNIFSLLISDKSNLSLVNYDIQDIFNAACYEMKPDMIKTEEIKFQEQDWLIARLCKYDYMPGTPKLVQNKLSIVVEYKDLVNLKGIDAIVNAANTSLVEGAGVCGAIFKACGRTELRNEIDRYLKQQGRSSVDISDVVVTDSYNLRTQQGAKYVFHAVGPIYREQNHMTCVNQLQKCLVNILKKCDENNIQSIAIPAISTGIYGFPKQLCAEIFKATFLSSNFKKPLNVHLVTLDLDTHNIFKFVFRDGKYKEMICESIENTPSTECLVVPINMQQFNTGITKRIFSMGGNHLKNQVEFMLNSQQGPIASNNSIFTCQSFNLKFKGVYNVMFVSGPQINVQKNLNFLLFEVFSEILDTAFTVKKFQSITIVFMAILQQCLPQDQVETYSGLRSIKIFLDSINQYKENHQGMIGKITILTNMQDFMDECQQTFIQ